MSKIGQAPVEIVDGVTVEIKDSVVYVKGSKGELTVDVPKSITVKIEDNTLYCERKSEEKKVKALHGLIRSLIANAIHGVSELWTKKLEVVGTGYRVKMEGKDLEFELGLSHKVDFKQPEDVTFSVEGSIVTISGIDKQRVGEVANQIKILRKPDAYKGKGIRYEGEYIKLKPGKKASA